MSCQLILKRSLQSVSAMADHSALQTAPKCWLLANSKLGSVSTFLLQISQGVGSGHRVGTTFFSGWTLLEVPGKSNLPCEPALARSVSNASSRFTCFCIYLNQPKKGWAWRCHFADRGPGGHHGWRSA